MLFLVGSCRSGSKNEAQENLPDKMAELNTDRETEKIVDDNQTGTIVIEKLDLLFNLNKNDHPEMTKNLKKELIATVENLKKKLTWSRQMARV